MERDNTEKITLLLADWSSGDREAMDRLIQVVHPQLVRLAENYLRRERRGHTLQATALVNEAYLKLVDQKRVTWRDRAHFMAVSATIMRRLLVDHARKRNAEKRGGPGTLITFNEALGPSPDQSVDLIALDDALEGLGLIDETKTKIVELRFFGGLSVEETAEVLDLSRATVNRHWSTAKTWLYKQLKKQ